jgi:DNA-binding transcriptional LysR family regulator
MIDLRALSYFVAVREEGSITAAAARCRIAQPSITNALLTLESRLGCRLFERTRRGCVPTPEGERLYQRAIALLAQARAMEQELAASKQAAVLNLHVQPDILLAAIRPLLDLLYRHRPRVRVTFRTGAGEADIAIVAMAGEDPRKRAHILWHEEYVLAVPATHPHRFLSRAGLSALSGLEMIDRPHCTRYGWFKEQLADAGVEPTIVARADSEETVLALLRMQVGAAVLPERHLPAEAPDIAVVRFAPDIAVTRSVGLVLNGRATIKALGTTIEAIKAALAVKPARSTWP